MREKGQIISYFDYENGFDHIIPPRGSWDWTERGKTWKSSGKFNGMFFRSVYSRKALWNIKLFKPAMVFVQWDLELGCKGWIISIWMSRSERMQMFHFSALSNNPLESSGHLPYWNIWQGLSVSLPLNTLSIRLSIRMLLSPFLTWPFFFSCSSSLWASTVGLHRATNFVPFLHSIYTTHYVTSSHLMTLNNTFVLMNPKCTPKLK